MTEQEAKQKTCHRTLAATVMPHNSRVEFNSAPCIGSACMAWRKIGPDEEQGDSFNEHTKPEGNGWVWRDHGVDNFGWFRPARNRSGFCGLAGKP